VQNNINRKKGEGAPPKTKVTGPRANFIMKTFFISDLHLGHKNVLRYDGRPFADINEHDETIINNWNSVVSDDDLVYILGDVGIASQAKIIDCLHRLKGKKHLILGNHDYKLLKNKDFVDCFVAIDDILEIKVFPKNERPQMLVLSHWPIPCFDGHFHGGYHFYGHVHNSWEWDMMEEVKYKMENIKRVRCNMYNVGIMVPYMGYYPRTFDEILSGYKKDHPSPNRFKKTP
jgi:calcineurin-like phosphoesterase family protein